MSTSAKVVIALATIGILASILAGIDHATDGNWQAAFLNWALTICQAVIGIHVWMIDRQQQRIDHAWSLIAVLAIALGRARRHQQEDHR